MSFSVLIPVYNEEDIIEKNVEKLIEHLDSLKEIYELLICSNGSTDRTDKIGKKLEKQYDQIRFFSIPKKGVGNAFKVNIRNARYEKLISLDMDLSIDLKFVKKALRLLNKVDMVLGSKREGKQERSKLREFISDAYIKLVILFLGMNYKDYSIAAKGYKKSLVEKYLDYIDYGSSYVVEIAYYIEQKGGKIKEVPVYCVDKRKSKFNLFHEIMYRFKNLILFWVHTKL